MQYAIRTHRGRVLLTGLALVGPAVGGMATATAAPTWTPPQLVLDTNHMTQGPQVEVAPDGTATAVWSRRTAPPYLRVESAMRRPGGAWTALDGLSQLAHHSTVPQIAVAPDGTATAVWARNDGYVMQIESATRTPGGPWSATTLLSSNEGTIEGADPNKPLPELKGATDPQVAVAADGSVTAIWVRRGSLGLLVETASRPAGGAWSTPTLLSDPAQEPTAPQIAVAADGTATAVWSSNDGATHRTLTATRPAGGSAWSTATPLSDSSAVSTTARVAVAPDGTTGAVWFRYPDVPFQIDIPFQTESATRPAGGPWNAAASLSGPSGSALSPQIAVGADGTMTAVWIRNTRVEATTRPPGGSWGPASPISDVTVTPESPRVAVAADGTAVAVWTRTVDDRVQAEVATRSPGGAWSSPTVLSDPLRRAANPQVSATTTGAVTAVWSYAEGPVASAVLDDEGPLIEDLVVPATGTAGQPVTFSVAPRDLWSAVGSTTWDLGTATAPVDGTVVTHTYPNPGTYTVTVATRDEHGNQSSDTATITIAAPPVPEPPVIPEHPFVPRGISEPLTPLDLPKGPGPLPPTVVPAPPRTASSCPVRGLTLLAITPSGSRREPRVRLTGLADRSLAGRTVTVLRNERRVATTTVRRDGTIVATAAAQLHRPSRDSARYRLRATPHRTAALRATRRVTITKQVRLGNGTVRIHGRITGARTRRVLTIQSRAACGTGPLGKAVHVRTDDRGNFVLALAPATDRTLTLVYRVRAHDTITLPIAVARR